MHNRRSNTELALVPIAPINPVAVLSDRGSIAAAIAGLLPVVNEGFVLLRDVFLADRKSRFYLGRIELQRTITQAWEETWVDPHGLPEQELQGFAGARPLLAWGILQQLVLLLQTLTNPEKLKSRYGIVVEKLGSLQRADDIAIEMNNISDYLYTIDSRFSSKDLGKFEEYRLRLLGLLQSIRFTLWGGSSEMEELIERMKEFNRNLQLFTAPDTRDVVQRLVFQLAVKDVGRDTDRTKRLEEAASYEAKQSIDLGERESYDDIAKFVNFGMAIQVADANMSGKKIFRLDDFSFDAPYYLNKHATLARLFDYPTKYQSRLVLVEWVSVGRGAPSTTDAILEALDETKVTWYILHAVKPEKLFLPATIGIIFDESNPGTIGIVFQLPPHIRGNLPTKPVLGRPGHPGGRVVRSPKTIAAQRMPTNLRQLILEREPKGIDLGIRFQLAKRLLDAVYLMHTARFTHGTIRPDTILLFPSTLPPTSNDPNTDPDPDPTTLDYSTPLLTGFHNAPLCTAHTPPPPPTPTWTQPEGLKPILKKPHRPPPQPEPREVLLDCYAHPEYRLNTMAGRRGSLGRGGFSRVYDLYGVGCVLLELGLWETLDRVGGGEVAGRAPVVGAGGVIGGGGVGEEGVWMDVETVRRAARGLDVITGSVYAEVTRMCLSTAPIPGDVLEYERRLAAMLAQIAA
ncbi:uncharacterized protein B0H64DRAFT_183381 [Chaetomium fimeti]|uniref:Protein kinase domain-containing protein n=1 Tax=Chaetomium fimeti TaxID=1854472 RepID=A0AAE0LR08_9PEZI|nr:hypothetical protein B0H64DRAFT_183381 [Chaetomium fimeti]